MKETVAAITTPLGEGGIGVIQISGPKAIEIVNKIFKCKKISDLRNGQNNSLFYGTVYHENNLIDEVIVNLCKKTDGHASEDMVEINCHGGIYLVNKILELVVHHGACKATWQDNAERFINYSHHNNNPQIDLIQKEAAQQIPFAKTNLNAKVLNDQYGGVLSSALSHLISEINELIGQCKTKQMESNKENLELKLLSIANDLKKILNTTPFGLAITNPQKIAVIGKPNAGKSTLVNALLGKERVIVHHEPGTTRDPVAELISIHDMPFELIDTAGIRETNHKIEKMSIKLTNDLILKADKIIVLLDGSRLFENDDLDLFKIIIAALSKREKVLDSDRSKNEYKFHIIPVISKCDLSTKFNRDEFSDLLKQQLALETDLLKISSTTGAGIEELEFKLIAEFKDYINYQPGLPVIFNRRQSDLLHKTYMIIDNILTMINKWNGDFERVINSLLELRTTLQKSIE